jgi:hypothetical protein
MNTQSQSSGRFLAVTTRLGIVSIVLVGVTARAQIPPSVVNEIKDVAGNRVEALTVLGGDYGASSGSFKADRTGREVHMDINKFGGAGDLGDPMQLGDMSGDLPIGWQPRFQGSLGSVTARNEFHSGVLAGDESKYDTFAIQFGGGARFWFSDHFSIAPTFMGMYGHTENDYDAHSAFAKTNFAAASRAGLVDWDVDTWTVIPAVNLQYAYTWHRVNFTMSSDFTFYHTESFDSSSGNFHINGDSEEIKNRIDVDIPLNRTLFGKELRTGGFFSRTDFFDGLKSGLKTDHLYEIHGRLVLDYLTQLWKVRWLGIGGSYLWGPGGFEGFSFGVDAAFRF